jgi:nucleotide-binding universal stress UspA family protein
VDVVGATRRNPAHPDAPLVDGPAWVEASLDRPCAVCGATGGCLRSGDGEFVVCQNTPSRWPITPRGWLHQRPPAAPARPRRSVLVPVGGPTAVRALPFAAVVAQGAGATLLLTTVADAGRPPSVGPAGWTLDDVARLWRARGRIVEVHTRAGAVAPALLAAARELRADLIAVSTHGGSRLGRWVSGSVTDQLLRAAEVPVLLVPARARRAWSAAAPRRVLVALDGSDPAERALGQTSAFAQALDADVTLLRVVEPTAASRDADPRDELDAARAYLEDVAARIAPRPRAGRGRGVEVVTEVGDPATAILRAARETGADAIALTAHGHRDLGHLVRGSVSAGVLRRADVPVLVVPPGALPRRPRPGPSATAARPA